jgi:hypothetical protein
MMALVGRGMILSALVVVLSVDVAQASSVSVAGGVMTITANPGEANRISFAASGSDTRGPLVRVSDSGSDDSIPNSTSGGRIVAGGACDQDSTGRHARCPTDGLTSVVVDLGDDGDEYNGSGMPINTQLQLGGGADTGKIDQSAGATGTLDGGPGDDTLDVGRSRGPTDVSGGADDDTVTYRSRTFQASATTGVTIRLDGTANDGATGEGDNVRTDVEKVIGSSRNDQLFGSSGPDILEGELGVDGFTGNGGADTFLLRDGVRDGLPCTDGNDTIDKDLKDPRFNFGCPIIGPLNSFTGAVKEGPNVRIASRRLHIGRHGRLRVTLACPAKLGHRCTGRLALREATRAGRRVSRRVRYRVRAGRRRTVTLHIGSRARRRVLRRKRVAVEAVERGHYGLKTTYGLRRVR